MTKTTQSSQQDMRVGIIFRLVFSSGVVQVPNMGAIKNI